MPTSAQVKVNTVRSTVRGDSNMLELTGYDNTNRRGFKKLFFETKKDGGLTKNAETANTLKQDDWVEVTMDDSSYKNVQSIKRIGEPTGAEAPPAVENRSGGGGGGGAAKTDKMSKADWAAKDRKKEIGVARSVALKAAVGVCGTSASAPTKKIVNAIEKLAFRFEAYLIKGDFNADLDADEPEHTSPEGPSTVHPMDEQPNTPVDVTVAEEGAPIDDDIPF